jgi:hypothetical protein
MGKTWKNIEDHGKTMRKSMVNISRWENHPYMDAHVAGTLWSTDIAMNKSSRNGTFCIDMLNFQRVAKETVEFPTKTLDFEPENEETHCDYNI